MSVSVTEVGPFERLVSFTIAESDLEQAKNRAARKLAREVRIPGFRPGRAPRKVVEATVGADRIRSEAIDDILPEKVGEILSGEGLEAAATPSLDALRDVDGGFEVDVKVALWPVLDETPAAYKSIDDVMEAQADLVEIVHTLKQVVCVKG